jgi:hypothetical protein
MARGDDEERIRPVVWLFVLASLLGAFGALYAIAAATRGSGDEVAAESARPFWERGRGEHSTGRTRRVWNGASFVGDEPAVGEAPTFEAATAADVRDPQVEAMERFMGPADGGVVPHFYPTYRTGRLASIRGDVPLPEGTSCEVRVLPVQTMQFSCLIRVMCDGVVLYPDPDQNAGYVECNLEGGAPATATDDGYSFADGDPTVAFDARAGSVSITDDGPGVPRFSAIVTLDPERG